MGWDWRRHVARGPRAGSVRTLRADDAGAVTVVTTWTLALVGVVVVLLAGYVILAADGRDTVQYIAFASGPLVSAVVGAILAKHQSAIASDVTAVRHQTNSLMTAQFDAASAEREAIAERIVTVTQQPDTVPPASSVTVT